MIIWALPSCLHLAPGGQNLYIEILFSSLLENHLIKQSQTWLDGSTTQLTFNDIFDRDLGPRSTVKFQGQSGFYPNIGSYLVMYLTARLQT